jgi:hypothetical protein
MAHAGQRHETTDPHGNDQHEGIVQFAYTNLRGDGKQEGRENVERGESLEEHTGHDQEHD